MIYVVIVTFLVIVINTYIVNFTVIVIIFCIFAKVFFQLELS